MNPDSWTSVLLIGCGALFVGLPLAEIFQMLRFKSRGQCTNGCVVRLEYVGAGEAPVTVANYEVAGRPFEIVIPDGIRESWQVGDEVAVYYFPHRPEKGGILPSR